MAVSGTVLATVDHLVGAVGAAYRMHLCVTVERRMCWVVMRPFLCTRKCKALCVYVRVCVCVCSCTHAHAACSEDPKRITAAAPAMYIQRIILHTALTMQGLASKLKFKINSLAAFCNSMSLILPSYVR